MQIKKNIKGHADRPIGLIQSSVGGTVIEEVQRPTISTIIPQFWSVLLLLLPTHSRSRVFPVDEHVSPRGLPASRGLGQPCCVLCWLTAKFRAVLQNGGPPCPDVADRGESLPRSPPDSQQPFPLYLAPSFVIGGLWGGCLGLGGWWWVGGGWWLLPPPTPLPHPPMLLRPALNTHAFAPHRAQALWYQGESNVAQNWKPANASWEFNDYYACLFKSKVTSWRKRFRSPDMFYGFVSLAACESLALLLRRYVHACTRVCHRRWCPLSPACSRAPTWHRRREEERGGERREEKRQARRGEEGVGWRENMSSRQQIDHACVATDGGDDPDGGSARSASGLPRMRLDQNSVVRGLTTWTILQKYDPNHLGMRCNGLPEYQMGLITSGCVPFSSACQTPESAWLSI